MGIPNISVCLLRVLLLELWLLRKRDDFVAGLDLFHRWRNHMLLCGCLPLGVGEVKGVAIETPEPGRSLGVDFFRNIQK